MLRIPPRGQILLTALLMSTGGAGIKAVSLTNWQISSFRSGIAAIVLLLAVRRLPRFSVPALLVGAAYGATVITFITANQLTTAANTVFFQGTAPLYLAVLAPILLGEHLPRRDVPILAVIAAGMLLLFLGHSEPTATAPNRLLGNAIGVLSGCSWSLTLLGLRWLEKRDPAAMAGGAGNAAVVGNIVTFGICLPMALPLAGVSTADVVGVAYLGVFQVGLAYVLLTRSITHVPAVEASLLLLVEPALSPLWAWWLHGETPGSWPLAGGVLIIGAAAWKAVRAGRTASGRHERPGPPPCADA
ncbi:MAG: DMT family transporter [Vicinamibacterales bacterium]